MNAVRSTLLNFFGSEKRVGAIGSFDIRTLRSVGSLMLVPIVVSFFFLMHESLRLDEAQSLWPSSRSFGGVLYIVAQDVHVPLYSWYFRRVCPSVVTTVLCSNGTGYI